MSLEQGNRAPRDEVKIHYFDDKNTNDGFHSPQTKHTPINKQMKRLQILNGTMLL